MSAIVTVRWVLSLLLRHPLAWLWVSLLVALWPAVAAFTPLGLTTSSRTEAGTLYEVAFIGLLAGHLAGIAILQRGSWFLEPVAALRRMGVELTVLGSAAGFFAGSAIGTAWALGAPTSATLLAHGLVAHLHLSGIALVLLHTPLVAPVRLAALPLCAWFLPAALDGNGIPGRLLGNVFGATRHLAFPFENDSAGTQWGAAFLPIIGLFGAAFLLSCPARHALRHPR